jgi:hypothetical protein
MTVYINVYADEVEIHQGAKTDAGSAGGGPIRDLVVVVRPGQKAFGRSYRFWRKLGPGEHEVTEEEGSQS